VLSLLHASFALNSRGKRGIDRLCASRLVAFADKRADDTPATRTPSFNRQAHPTEAARNAPCAARQVHSAAAERARPRRPRSIDALHAHYLPISNRFDYHGNRLAFFPVRQLADNQSARGQKTDRSGKGRVRSTGACTRY